MTDKKTEALEALEEIHPGNMTPMAESNWNKAIIAISEALAEQPVQQEPVAIADGTFNHNCPIGTLLYTSSQSGKPWVGLSDKEIKSFIPRDIAWEYEIGFDETIKFARAIEAKLREKNASPCKPLTDERILHFVDTHVGGPSPSYPLDNSDWINFVRAIEAAHGIKGDA